MDKKDQKDLKNLFKNLKKDLTYLHIKEDKENYILFNMQLSKIGFFEVVIDRSLIEIIIYDKRFEDLIKENLKKGDQYIIEIENLIDYAEYKAKINLIEYIDQEDYLKQLDKFLNIDLNDLKGFSFLNKGSLNEFQNTLKGFELISNNAIYFYSEIKKDQILLSINNNDLSFYEDLKAFKNINSIYTFGVIEDQIIKFRFSIDRLIRFLSLKNIFSNLKISFKEDQNHIINNYLVLNAQKDKIKYKSVIAITNLY